MPFSSKSSSITSARPLFQTSSNQQRSIFLFSSDMRTPIQGRELLTVVLPSEPYTNFTNRSSRLIESRSSSAVVRGVNLLGLRGSGISAFLSVFTVMRCRLGSLLGVSNQQR